MLHVGSSNFIRTSSIFLTELWLKWHTFIHTHCGKTSLAGKQSYNKKSKFSLQFEMETQTDNRSFMNLNMANVWCSKLIKTGNWLVNTKYIWKYICNFKTLCNYIIPFKTMSPKCIFTQVNLVPQNFINTFFCLF